MKLIVADTKKEANEIGSRIFGHSADVDLALHVGAERLPLTHVGGTYLRLKNSRPGLSGDASVEIVVDGVSTLERATIVDQSSDGHELTVRYEDAPADHSIAAYLDAVGSPVAKR